MVDSQVRWYGLVAGITVTALPLHQLGATEPQPVDCSEQRPTVVPRGEHFSPERAVPMRRDDPSPRVGIDVAQRGGHPVVEHRVEVIDAERTQSRDDLGELRPQRRHVAIIAESSAQCATARFCVQRSGLCVQQPGSMCSGVAPAQLVAHRTATVWLYVQQSRYSATGCTQNMVDYLVSAPASIAIDEPVM